jgi:hypothetical protein
MAKLLSIIATVCTVVCGANAQAAISADPVVLVRETVDREIRSARDFSFPYRYVLRKETNSGISVRQMLETADGMILARTITWNGKPQKQEDQVKEDQRLDQIATDSEERAKKLEEQRQDSGRAMKLLAALPSSSIFTWDGKEVVNGRETVRLAFKPNPDFSPDAKETYLLKAAEGKIWIDAASKRLVRISGATTDSVNIGWGLLGHIDKGGSFFMEQAIVPGGESRGEFRIREMRIDAKGKALLFKTIRIKQHQSAYDFVPVQPMTVAAAVQTLKQLGSNMTAAASSVR